MHFLDFCRAHGILVDREPPIGVWKRYPTEDHPHKKNGAVKFMGDVAFVQNHATDVEISVWKAEGDTKIDHERIRRIAKAADDEIKQKRQEAAKKAGWIMNQTQIGFHPYLAKKGFKDMQADVWKRDDGLILVLPMRIGPRIAGCQLINEEGQKRFLFGQATSGAELVMDNKGIHILCEGFATALSVKYIFKEILKRRYVIHVCFSAHNMKNIAARLPGGLIIADHDISRTGQRVAEEIGWPYYMPPVVGDFNDYHMSGVGVLQIRKELLALLRELEESGKLVTPK